MENAEDLYRVVRSVGRKKSTNAYDKTVCVNIDYRLYASLSEKAKNRGLTVSSLVRTAIIELLDQLPAEPVHRRQTPAPSPNRKQRRNLKVQLPEDMKEKLFDAATARNMYTSELVRAACIELDAQLPLERF